MERNGTGSILIVWTTVQVPLHPVSHEYPPYTAGLSHFRSRQDQNLNASPVMDLNEPILYPTLQGRRRLPLVQHRGNDPNGSATLLNSKCRVSFSVSRMSIVLTGTPAM